MFLGVLTTHKIIEGSKMDRETANAALKKTAKWVGGIIAGVIAFFMVLSMFRTVEAGYTDHFQNTFTGSKAIYHGPDWYLSPLYIGKESTWKDDTTISFSNSAEAGKFSSNNPSIGIRFADTYEAKLPLTARLVLPSDDEHMFMVVKSFRSYKNLINSLYVPTMEDVTVNTAQQFTAEEVTQGGLNGLKSAIEDQANKGVYVTKRERVIVDSSTSTRNEPGADKSNNAVKTQQITVWKAVPKLKDGKVLRTSNPFEKYGIDVLQVNLKDPIPETLLETLLIAKKTSVAKKILSVQEQDNAKEDIKTARLKGEALREKAEQERMIVADAEIIERKKEVELAGLQAKREIVDREKLAALAIIDKKKDLQIATANEGIQKANERAAKFEAQSKLHNGLADAQITKAKYLAIDKHIKKMEVEETIALAKYKALPNIKLDMPNNVMMTGGGEGYTPIADLANMEIINKIGQMK